MIWGSYPLDGPWLGSGCKMWCHFPIGYGSIGCRLTWYCVITAEPTQILSSLIYQSDRTSWSRKGNAKVTTTLSCSLLLALTGDNHFNLIFKKALGRSLICVRLITRKDTSSVKSSTFYHQTQMGSFPSNYRLIRSKYGALQIQILFRTKACFFINKNTSEECTKYTEVNAISESRFVGEKV